MAMKLARNSAKGTLEVGTTAPAFRLKSDEGADLSLSDFRGHRVILFFFPKANTTG